MARKRGGDDDGMEQVTAYHKDLQLCLREHESKFDNAVLLAAGGAFTISAAFISDLPTPLRAGTWLAISWSAWGLCLLAGVGGHLVGAHATKRVLDLLDTQVYDFQVLMSGRAAKLIEPLNVATFVLLIVGFIAFGRFTFANLDFGGRHGDEEVQQAVGKEEGHQEEVPSAGRARNTDTRGSAQRANAGTTVAAPQIQEDVRTADDRKETTNSPTPSTSDAAARAGAGQAPAVHQGQAAADDGSHGAEPAARMAPAD